MKVKEESDKVALKLNIQKTKILAFGPITSWQIDGETVADFIFWGTTITADGDCSHEIKRHLHQMAKLLELQHQFFQWMFSIDFLWDGLIGSPCSPGDSWESSPMPRFGGIDSLELSFLYGPTQLRTLLSQ